MTALEHDLKTAISLQQNGDFAQAETLYQNILNQAPQAYRAMTNLGTLYCQRGDLNRGVELLQASLAIYPQQPYACNSLGAALYQLQQYPQAIHNLSQAIDLKPDLVEAWCSRGDTYLALQQYEAARNDAEQAIRLNPQCIAAWDLLGKILSALQNPHEAILFYRHILTLNPKHFQASMNLHALLRQTGQFSEDLTVLDQILEQVPEYADAMHNRGVALCDLKRYAEALDAYQAAINLNCHNAWYFYNRAKTYWKLNRRNDALRDYNQALKLQPDFMEALHDRGLLFWETGKFHAAMQDFQRIIEIDPQSAKGHFGIALLQLTQGQYLQGWKNYEWRWQYSITEETRPNHPQPLWLGETSLNGKKLLVHSEQGVGDTLQFCRYLPLLEGTIYFVVPPELLTLMQTLNFHGTCITTGAVLPEFDVHTQLLSLPHACKTELETIPASIPYLAADPEKIETWRTRLKQYTRPRIGVACSGRIAHPDDQSRSIPLVDLSPLLNIPATFHLLQTEFRPADEGTLQTETRWITHAASLSDFSDTAALIENLDLIISVDTSVAHLAGALGKPIWLLLAFSSEFRWLTDRSDSPWYPTMTLFRQVLLDDWDEVITRVSAALRSWSDH